MSRLERILHKLALKHAPHLLPSDWGRDDESPERLGQVARLLADEGVLVLVGDVPANLKSVQQVHVEDWIDGYGRLYNLLVSALFPSLLKIQAYYADDQDNTPVIVVLEGDATAAVATFAGYVTPYVAARQHSSEASDVELYGVMNLLLEALEAGDLPRAAFDNLREQGKGILRQMLNATVRHLSLTSFDGMMFDLNVPGTGGQPERAASAEPAAEPDVAEASPPPPNELPEEGQFRLEHMPEEDADPTPTEQLFINPVPLPRTSKQRKPPVPPLPEDDDRSC